VYEPTCTIKIKFEGQERLWVYPLALNGRTIESVSIGGIEYEPKRGECEMEINIDMTAIQCDKCGYKIPKGTDLKKTRFCGGCGKEAK
jgi:hypothetical protein